jgi:hypothetical protein
MFKYYFDELRLQMVNPLVQTGSAEIKLCAFSASTLMRSEVRFTRAAVFSLRKGRARSILNRKLSGPQSRVGCGVEGKDLALTGNRTLVIQFAGCQFTDECDGKKERSATRVGQCDIVQFLKSRC